MSEEKNTPTVDEEALGSLPGGLQTMLRGWATNNLTIVEKYDLLLAAVKKQAYAGDLDPNYAKQVLKKIEEFDEDDRDKMMFMDADLRLPVLFHEPVKPKFWEAYDPKTEEGLLKYFEQTPKDERRFDHVWRYFERRLRQKLEDDRIRWSPTYLDPEDGEYKRRIEWRDPRGSQKSFSKFVLDADDFRTAVESIDSFNQELERVVGLIREDENISELISDFRIEDHYDENPDPDVLKSKIAAAVEVTRDYSTFYDDDEDEKSEHKVEPLLK